MYGFCSTVGVTVEKLGKRKTKNSICKLLNHVVVPFVLFYLVLVIISSVINVLSLFKAVLTPKRALRNQRSSVNNRRNSDKSRDLNSSLYFSFRLFRQCLSVCGPFCVVAYLLESSSAEFSRTKPTFSSPFSSFSLLLFLATWRTIFRAALQHVASQWPNFPQEVHQWLQCGFLAYFGEKCPGSRQSKQSRTKFFCCFEADTTNKVSRGSIFLLNEKNHVREYIS